LKKVAKAQLRALKAKVVWDAQSTRYIIPIDFRWTLALPEGPINISFHNCRLVITVLGGLYRYTKLEGVCCHPHMVAYNKLCLGRECQRMVESHIENKGDLIMAVSLIRQVLEFPSIRTGYVLGWRSCPAHRDLLHRWELARYGE
jgi:hypothetical protein